MLYLTWTDRTGVGPLGETGRKITRERSWHTGETLPPIGGRVVTFQADGDELDVILEALRRYARPGVRNPRER